MFAEGSLKGSCFGLKYFFEPYNETTSNVRLHIQHTDKNEAKRIYQELFEHLRTVLNCWVEIKYKEYTCLTKIVELVYDNIAEVEVALHSVFSPNLLKIIDECNVEKFEIKKCDNFDENGIPIFSTMSDAGTIYMK